MNYLVNYLSALYIVMAIADIGNNAMFAILSCIIFSTIFFQEKENIREKYLNNNTFKYFITFIITITIEVIFSGNLNFEYPISRFSIFLPIILFIYFKNKPNRLNFIYLVFFVWTVVAIRASYLYTTGQMSGRALAAHLQENIIFSGGGYGFAVGSALFSVFLLDLILWRKIKHIKLAIMFILLLFNVVVLTKSTITILAMITGMVLSIICRTFHMTSLNFKTRNQLIGLLITLVLFIFFITTHSYFGNYLIEYSYSLNGILSKRLLEVGIILTGGDFYHADVSDSLGRINGIIDSLKIFIYNPIFGLISKYGSNFYTLLENGIGGHSELFDSLAIYGIFGEIPYLNIFINGIINPRKHLWFEFGFSYTVTFLILFIFNPCLYRQLNIILFYFIPTLLLISSEFKENELII